MFKKAVDGAIEIMLRDGYIHSVNLAHSPNRTHTRPIVIK
jgi:hypothetical protein